MSNVPTSSRASALLHRPTCMLRDRVRRKSVGAGLLAKALGPRKLYRLPKRYRGQARSYTVYVHVARSRAPQIRRSRLAGEGVGSAKIISTAETLSRASALLHRPTFMLRDRVRRKPCRRRLAGEGGGFAKNVDGRSAIAGKRAPTPSCVVAMSSPVPQARCRSALARESVGLATGDVE